jgi:hypothetical protein
MDQGGHRPCVEEIAKVVRRREPDEDSQRSCYRHAGEEAAITVPSPQNRTRTDAVARKAQICAHVSPL